MSSGETYSYVAAVIYVTCTTFNREVRHVWKRPPSIVSGIFILDKYTALVFYPVAAAKYFVRDDASCQIFVRISQALEILLYLVWATFCSLRVFAISGRRWYVTGVVFSLRVVPVALYIFQDIHQPRRLSVLQQLACLIFADMLVLGVTWRRTYGIVRFTGAHGSLTAVLLRDGLIYFVVWTVLNALHIAGTRVPSIRYVTLFTDALISILVSSFMLNLRQAGEGWNADTDYRLTWNTHPSFISCPAILAPLRATLDHSYDVSHPETHGRDSGSSAGIWNWPAQNRTVDVESV